MLVEGTSRYGQMQETYKPVVLNQKICSDKTLKQGYRHVWKWWLTVVQQKIYEMIIIK